MDEGKTNNINTYMEGWKTDAVATQMFNFELLDSLDLACSLFAYHCSVKSKGAFTPEQCRAVIESWPEYKDAVERLGGGEK